MGVRGKYSCKDLRVFSTSRWSDGQGKEQRRIRVSLPRTRWVSIPEMIYIKIFHAPRTGEILSLRDNLQQDHRGGCGQGNQNVNQEIF